MTKTFSAYIFSLLSVVATVSAQTGQTKQADMNGKEVCADAPWRMLIADTAGVLNGLPVTIFIDDADLFGANAELVSVNISLKNASDNSFGNALTFNNYTDSAFLALFSDKSITDNQLDCQSFDASLPVKDAAKTIVFTSNNCGWPFTCTYVDVTHKFWYFTFTIPPDKLSGFSDIIDIQVDFELRWEPDNTTRLRVFRSGNDIPRFAGWYRGDTHFHSMYTQNQIEFGLPLNASRTAAKKVGLDWITVTDHSTDYDNYGSDMQTNWAKQGYEILDLNSQDSDFVFIRGLESSQLNSDGQLVHMLNYPSANNPYMMNFVADGGGDIVTTHDIIEDFLLALAPTGGFAYAAHPYAEGDKLSSAGNGGLWNVSDTGFFVNGTVVPGVGTISCNDLATSSDMFNPNPANGLLRHNFAGGEIWNCGTSMETTDDYSDPWNVTNDNGITPLAPLANDHTDNHLYRLQTGLKVSDFMNRRGLTMKNNNPLSNNYKFFMSAGTDAHGSFNYSNTSFLLGITGHIDDNAIGKLSTVAYCPDGMGHYGNHILKALKNGNTIMSDGPLATISLRFNNDTVDRLFPGRDTSLSESDFTHCTLHIKTLSNPEFGIPDTITLVLATESFVYSIKIPASGNYAGDYYYPVDSLFHAMTNGDSLSAGEYFFVRTELQTYKDYSSQESLYRRPFKYFHSFTNPIWIGKKELITSLQTNRQTALQIYPNPVHNIVNLDCSLIPGESIILDVYDMNGRTVFERTASAAAQPTISLDVSGLPAGLYMIRVKSETTTGTARFIKQ
ncbi:MAG: T9SS type A sorting domain-containing protein [Bacteroidota bacterium]